MNEYQKYLIKNLRKDEGPQPGVGTPFSTSMTEDEGSRREERYRDAEGEISVSSPAPAPAPAPSPALGATPGMGTGATAGVRMQEERETEEGYPSTPKPYDPRTRDAGTNLNSPASRASRVKAEEESEDEEEAMKALSGLFGAIVQKNTDPRNPSATMTMRKK